LKRRAALLLLGCLGACRIGGVEPLPITGEVPQVVAIWPLAVGASPPEADLWFTGLASALGRRGYRVVTHGVTREVLSSSDLTAGATDSHIGRALRADAVLRLEVRAFEADGTRALQHAEWDLEWHLVSTRGHGTQWSYQHTGTYNQAARLPRNPGRRIEEQRDMPDIVPVGGRGPRGFRDPAELLAHLHNTAMEHLPKK